MNKKTTFREWLVIANTAGHKLEGTAKRPLRIGKHKTPENFDAVTFGQLIDLTKTDDMVQMVTITMGMTAENVLKAKATEVVRYILWMTEQIEKINKLFSKLKTAPTPMEIQAGSERLNFGIFGIIDTYARRMGISNHDDVLKTPWLVVYKCLDIDHQVQEYERRYNKILNEQIRNKKK